MCLSAAHLLPQPTARSVAEKTGPSKKKKAKKKKKKKKAQQGAGEDDDNTEDKSGGGLFVVYDCFACLCA